MRTLIGVAGLSVADHALDPLDRLEHEHGVGVPVASGIFCQEPAPAHGRHDGREDRVIVRVRRQ